METEKFLSLAAELESQISGLYEITATLTADDSLSKKLIKISREKLGYASALRKRKEFREEAAAVPGRITIDEGEFSASLQECQDWKNQFKPGLALLPALIWLLSLEKRVEKIHRAASLFLTGVHLKQFFQTLAEGDRERLESLYTLISSLQGQ